MKLPTLAACGLLGLVAHAAADPGDVIWYFEIPTPGSPLHRPSLGADSTIYWSVNSLYAITPGGQEIWSQPNTDPNPVGVGPDGTLYVGGWQPPPDSHLPALKAFSATGDHLWDFSDFGQVIGFIGGPNVGPDGNVYAVTWGGFNPNPPGFGAFSLTPAGSLRWHVDGFAHQMAGTVPTEIVFSERNMYKAESHAPMPPAQQQSGLVAIDLGGDIDWQHPAGIPSNSPYRQPAVSPLNGNVHLSVPTRTLRTFTPDGSLAWFHTGDFTPTGFGTPAVGPNGSVYIINGSRHVISLDASGGVRWVARDVVPNTALAPEVSPDGSLLVFGTEACFGGTCPARILALDTSDGSVVFNRALPTVPGGVPTVRTQPRFSKNGAVAYIAADAFTAFTHSYLFAIEVAEPGCLADWNGSGIVNSQDFFDFLAAFFAADPPADFNADGMVNSQDLFDFLTVFFAGC